MSSEKQRIIDLKSFMGFGLSLNNNALESSDFDLGRVYNYTIDNMKGHLLNQEIYCPESFYTKYVGVDYDEVLQKKKIRLNFYVLSGGTAGIEYIKTLVYCVSSYPVILECLRGRGTIVMQSETDAIISYVRAGNKIIVPAGYNVAISNIKFAPLIISEFLFSGTRQMKTMDEVRGAGYYVIRKNSRSAIVINPHHGSVPPFRKIKWGEVNPEYGITAKTPVLKRLLRRYEKFQWLFKKDSILTL